MRSRCGTTADSADLVAKDDVIGVDEVTATLTDAGAKAFGGFYPAGTELDPVDLAVALSEDADLPDGGDGDGSGSGSGSGSDSGGGSGTTTGGAGSTTGGAGGALASTGSRVPAVALGAAAAVTAVAGAGVVLAVRRRRAV
ncbi:HtaA domain-containing protein [Streptomyces siamensis]|uniref:Htaa domain-containing protein n=1 Tax=Streptomyces siamensis TaxID=1274986 RepID=A0ABP9IKA3_9ACTN